jgi:hypothetical protein
MPRQSVSARVSPDATSPSLTRRVPRLAVCARVVLRVGRRGTDGTTPNKEEDVVPAWGWILIVIGAALVAALVVWSVMTRKRTERLRDQFGPEYNRVASSADSKREAEAELVRREERREELDIRPLPEASRARFVGEWQTIQAEFVDEPTRAVARADSLLQRVMAERGYPVEKFDQRAADLSIDHPKVVENYREGHRLATKSQADGSDTEELRQAMRHYRGLFEELVESS